MNTRTDAEGNKVLFLEEVQSDWGQKGKREGFKSEGARSGVSNIGAVLQGKDQTGPVLTITAGGSSQFIGRREFSDFVIRGDGESDEHGLLLTEAHNVILTRIAVRDTVGVPWVALSSSPTVR